MGRPHPATRPRPDGESPRLLPLRGGGEPERREEPAMEGGGGPQQLQEEAVEAWLDDHGDFARAYFVKKATR